MIMLLLTGAFAYLLASIPFGLVVARLFGLGDLRQIGSGNIGATNVLRTGNKPAAALTLILDSGKGAAAVIITNMMLPESEAVAIAAVMSVVGHCFPVWLGFRGGKGVATGIGVVLAMHPLSGVVMCAVWLATAVVGRISSLAAIIAYISAPVSLYLMLMPPAQIPLTAAGVMIALLQFIVTRRISDDCLPAKNHASANKKHSGVNCSLIFTC